MYATTSQFARLTGVTAKALQLYERRGLLKPRRTRAGYRRYTYTDLLRLERVLALKGLGLSLKTDRSVGPRRIARVRRYDAAARAAGRTAAPDRPRCRAIDTIAEGEHPQDALDKFVNESSWDRWEARRQEFPPPVPRAPDRASPSRVALFKKIHDALERDPRVGTGRSIHRSTCRPYAGLKPCATSSHQAGPFGSVRLTSTNHCFQCLHLPFSCYISINFDESNFTTRTRLAIALK